MRWGAEMRFSYTKALYDTYVAPDLNPQESAQDMRVDELLGSA